MTRPDGSRDFGETFVHYTDGFAREPRRLGDALGVAFDRVRPLPDWRLLEKELDFDVVLLLGNDWREFSSLPGVLES